MELEEKRTLRHEFINSFLCQICHPKSEKFNLISDRAKFFMDGVLLLTRHHKYNFASPADFCRLETGSSPRVRGTLEDDWTRQVFNRFIPACAGNTP